MRLRKENARLREERDVLEKATAWFAREGRTIEGEVRDLSSLRPLVGAEIVLTTGRKGYERRAVTDALGRFVISYSVKARDDVTVGESVGSQIFFGHEPTNDTVDDVKVTVSCPGRRPWVERSKPVLHAKPAVFFLEPLDPESVPRFDCGR